MGPWDDGQGAKFQSTSLGKGSRGFGRAVRECKSRAPSLAPAAGIPRPGPRVRRDLPARIKCCAVHKTAGVVRFTVDQRISMRRGRRSTPLAAMEPAPARLSRRIRAMFCDANPCVQLNDVIGEVSKKSLGRAYGSRGQPSQHRRRPYATAAGDRESGAELHRGNERRRAGSMPSTPPNRRVWGWVYRSAGPSSKLMASAVGDREPRLRRDDSVHSADRFPMTRMYPGISRAVHFRAGPHRLMTPQRQPAQALIPKRRLCREILTLWGGWA